MLELDFVKMTLNKALKEYPSVRELTLYPGSSMSDIIELVDEGYSRRGRLKVLIAFNKETPVGWVWFKRCYSYNSDSGVQSKVIRSWFYVAQSHRRTGLGTKLFHEASAFAKKQHRPLLVEAWDHRSSSFFSNFKVKTV